MKDNKKFEIILTNDLLEVNDFIKTDFGTIDGSEVIFLGITRDNNFDRNVSKLFYESYQDMAIIEITDENFEEKVLLKHPRLTDYWIINEEKAVFVFDFQDTNWDWEHFLNGNYSLIKLASGEVRKIDSRR